MAKPPELTLEGFTIHSILGAKTYRWSWIYYFWPWPRRLELLLSAPELGKMGGVPAIPREHVPLLLRHPSFPRWLFNPRRAVQYGLGQSEAEAYGPPPSTTWVRGMVPRNILDSPPSDFDFTLFVDRVGAFRQGAAFAYQDDIRVVPWGHLGVDPELSWKDLGVDPSPVMGGCIRFQVGRKLEFGGDQFFVTHAQARAILETSEAGEVPVGPELANALGVSVRGRAQSSPPR